MKKLFCLLLVFAMTVSAFAQKIKVTGSPPTVKGGAGVDEFNRETAKAFQEVIDELNAQANDVAFNNPTKFLQAMGNSSVYASHGATTRGYSGYKLFSATVGTTVGLQLPESISSIMDDAEGIADSLEKDGDIKLGLSPNVFNANIGLNMGVMKFLPEHLGILKRDHLYVGLLVGYFKLPSGLFEDISYKNFTLGFTANYQIIPTLSLAGLVKWRGINVGSGLIYNSASFSASGLSFGDPISQPIQGNTSLVIDPKVSMNIDVTTFTIPLEAVTAIKLLIFNIPFGIGADIAFGKTSSGFGLASDLDYEGLPVYFTQDKKGELSVSGGVSNKPSIFNFKIMTGFGLSMGPVIFDVPITIYPADGYNVGVTIGAVF